MENHRSKAGISETLKFDLFDSSLAMRARTIRQVLGENSVL